MYIRLYINMPDTGKNQAEPILCMRNCSHGPVRSPWQPPRRAKAQPPVLVPAREPAQARVPAARREAPLRAATCGPAIAAVAASAHSCSEAMSLSSSRRSQPWAITALPSDSATNGILAFLCHRLTHDGLAGPRPGGPFTQSGGAPKPRGSPKLILKGGGGVRTSVDLVTTFKRSAHPCATRQYTNTREGICCIKARYSSSADTANDTVDTSVCRGVRGWPTCARHGPMDGRRRLAGAASNDT